MREKHYNFWLHAKEGNQPKPALGFNPGSYQQKEHVIVSLSSYDQQRETAERQEQAQQLRLQQYLNRGPRLGGRGMS